ncbi:WD repeat protein [Seiridium cupressi]
MQQSNMPSNSTIDEAKAASKRKREADEYSKSKRARRDKQKSKIRESIGSLRGSSPAAEQAEQNGTKPDTSLVETKVQQVKQELQKAKKPGKKHDASSWKLSQSMGGRMLDIDPILTPDDQYLIIAYTNSVQVYSAADSLLFRKIPLDLSAKVNERVVAISLSPTSPNLIWIASSTGRIWQGDWMAGTGFDRQIQLDCILLTDFTVEPMVMKTRKLDVPFVSLLVNDTWQIVACYVQDMTLKNKKLVLSRGEMVENLKFMSNGQALAASSRNNILLGSLKSTTISHIKELAYEFFILDCPDEITCLDFRVAERIHLNRKSQAQIGDNPVLEVVVGCARGAIYYYNDLLPQLRYLQKAGARGASLQPRKYHWHRKAVHAVKWSQDGNYIISGGSESVLVQWQLDTQKIDILPHLTATIENIVISDRGSNYVVHLDDNSTMVMTTAEMKPITYISGIQSLVTPRPPSKDSLIKRVGFVEDQGIISKIPAVINPKDRTRLLLCVGNGQQGAPSGTAAPTPLLQTLDLSTTQGISKQAMTRTHPTDVNTTSKGFPITEPRVAHMAYSHDGKWLATVDQWQPPSRDTEILESQPSDRLEVYLKFWTTAAEGQSLELVSRINSPHYTGRDESVLDLAADPTSHTFATIGEDGVLRLWTPAIRQRDGIVVKSRTGREMESWACASTIHLQENKALADSNAVPVKTAGQRSGAVSFSEDGSMIACAFQNGAESAVYLIDVKSGTVVDSLDGLIRGQVQSLRVLSSQLIVLSQDLVVYDIVQDVMIYGIQLSADNSVPEIQALSQLAVDYPSRSFAVAISHVNRLGLVKSDVAVFNSDQSAPEFVQPLPHPVVSLIATPSSSGFLVLDSSAQICSITQSTDANSVAVAQSLADISLDKLEPGNSDDTNLLAVVNEDQDMASDDEMEDVAEDAMDEDDEAYPVVVAPQKLTELFDAAPPFAMPPIEDMFYKVTKLFSVKPNGIENT